MKLTRAQKKERLQTTAEGIIEALLEWDEGNEAPDLTEIEEEVLKLRERFGRELTSVMIEGQETTQPAENPKCPECGEEMRYKGMKKRDVESRLGGVKIVRGNYYCARCKSGIFPPGQTTEAEERAVE